MPSDHVERLNAELNKITASKDFQERLTRLDNVVLSGSAGSFASIIQAESQANAKIIKDAAIRLE
jgi:tripartite-type tricarboxylate transporter receptor subunit TctC